MVRPKSEVLTDHELTILKVFWDEAPLSVYGLLERFPKTPKPAYNSLLTAVTSLEKKGYLTYEKRGRFYYYSPKIGQNQYRKFALGRLISSVFNNDPMGAAVMLVEEDQLSADEIKTLSKLLESL